MPFIRSSFTEATGQYTQSQYRYKGNVSKCADLELNAWECMEAYGHYRGERYCHDYMEDLEECFSSRKQRKRIHYMTLERVKQLKAGERSLSDFWGPKPPKDSFVKGPMIP
ncbi:hypothetical protein HDE_08379 [Halotydeus destructor]|nr:hypothetical protein HDE_08379 [Halotydeus destructor]